MVSLLQLLGYWLTVHSGGASEAAENPQQTKVQGIPLSVSGLTRSTLNSKVGSGYFASFKTPQKLIFLNSVFRCWKEMILYNDMLMII